MDSFGLFLVFLVTFIVFVLAGVCVKTLSALCMTFIPYMITSVTPSHRKQYALRWTVSWANGPKFVLRLLLSSVSTVSFVCACSWSLCVLYALALCQCRAQIYVTIHSGHNMWVLPRGYAYILGFAWHSSKPFTCTAAIKTNRLTHSCAILLSLLSLFWDFAMILQGPAST